MFLFSITQYIQVFLIKFLFNLSLLMTPLEKIPRAATNINHHPRAATDINHRQPFHCACLSGLPLEKTKGKKRVKFEEDV